MYSIIWLIAVKICFLHPFHVSVCDVAYKSEDKHLKISVRMFLDDLEMGLQLYTNDPKMDIAKVDSAFLYSNLEAYLKDNLILTTKNKPLTLVFLGGEIEDDVMWCYLEVEKLRPFNKITIVNSILSKVFKDQENLVHVRKDGVVRSMRMNDDDNIKTVSWTKN
jgi:hypothetical protein